MALACSCSTLAAAAPAPETALSASSCLYPASSTIPSLARAKARASAPLIASTSCGTESGRDGRNEGDGPAVLSRRSVCRFAAAGAAAMAAAAAQGVENAHAGEYTDMPALRGKDYGKTITKYPDYTQTESGLQYKDLRPGSGAVPQPGETVVVDWDGYTIGYYGRIFEARNKAKGGSFEGNEKDFFRFKLGQAEVIPAFEEAVASMRVGGVRRILVPPTLGYPDNDYGKSGPRPTTFSGQRALDFVLKNQGLIDKTLLFDIELLKVVPAS